jgi:hypothetical protein
MIFYNTRCRRANKLHKLTSLVSIAPFLLHNLQYGQAEEECLVMRLLDL